MDEAENPETESCASNLCQLNMGYRSEDHDQIRTHQKHEDMYLSAANNHENIHTVLKFNGFISDQTPTPIRFLRHYEDVCLLQDINLNPFDLEFRKASQNKNSKVHLSVPENHVISGSLETPRILPPIESDETISSTSHDDGQSSVSENRHHSQLSAIITEVSSPETNCQKQSCSIDEKKEGRKRLTLNVCSASEDGQNNSNIISTPTPVITAGPSVSQSLLGIGSSTPTLNTPNNMTTNVPHISLNGVGLGFGDLNTPALSAHYRISSTPPLTSQVNEYPVPESVNSVKNIGENSHRTAQAQCTAASYGSIPPSTSATVLQLLLRLPDGQAIPVEIPATPVISAISSKTMSSIVKSIVPAYPATTFPSVITNPTPSLAKMKLKQVLASSNTAARPGAPRHSRATTADRIADLTKPKALNTVSSNNSAAAYDACGSSGGGILQGSTTIKLTRRKSSFSEEHPEEKRKKFLERNRVAAVRCREKKKRLVESMATKSDELNAFNQKLQGEVTALRSEVVSLKCLLLKHKNCPVTLAMQGKNNCGSEKYLKDCQEQFECKLQEKKFSESSYVSSAPHCLSVHSYKEMPRSCLPNSPTSFLVPENPSSLDAVIKFRKRSNSLTSVPPQPILMSSDNRLILPLETTILKEAKRIAPKELMTLGVIPRSSEASSLTTQPKILFIESASMAAPVPSQR